MGNFNKFRDYRKMRQQMKKWLQKVVHVKPDHYDFSLEDMIAHGEDLQKTAKNEKYKAFYHFTTELLKQELVFAQLRGASKIGKAIDTGRMLQTCRWQAEDSDITDWQRPMEESCPFFAMIMDFCQELPRMDKNDMHAFFIRTGLLYLFTIMR